MLAANAQQAVQVGMDFDSPVQEPSRPDTVPTSQDEPLAAVETIRSRPAGRLYLREQEKELVIELRFAYYDGTVEFTRWDRDSLRIIMTSENSALRIERSRAREADLAADLLEHQVRPYRSGCFVPDGDPLEWVKKQLPTLAETGFQIFGRENLLTCRIRGSVPALSLSVKPSGGMLECSVNVSVDGIPVALKQVFESATSGNPYVRLSDGSTGLLPQEWIHKLCDLIAVCKARPGDTSLSVSRNQQTAVEILDSLATESNWQEIAFLSGQQLESFSGVEHHQVPAAFKGALRPYQQSGLDWFFFLQKFRFGGCLADDMGLGKTVQTLALLLGQKNERAATAPRTSLLVVPTSLMFNWMREARAFAPTLLVMNYHGPQRKRYHDTDMLMADVVLTTYGTVQRDLDTLADVRFNYIILDEAQSIKNPLSGTSKSVKRLTAVHRLALSGTPIENNLSELWSLFSFLNPGMFGSFRSFSDEFARPIERDANQGRAALLRRTINPCILRRTKEQVATELPPKTETVQYTDMEPAQRRLYEITRDMYRTKLMPEIDKTGIDESRMQLLEALMRLRQICCHPRLVDRGFSANSGKFLIIDETLEELIAGGHKLLIFSQFVTALDLLRTRMSSRGIATRILTGRTRNRAVVVDAFQNDPSISVMLISLKAGGTGLNLTAADYVIHLDPWWNPAAERQASDRAHRIGQTKPVFVYKYITRNSVEERVLELQEAKKDLFDSVITTEISVFKRLTRSDISRLLS